MLGIKIHLWISLSSFSILTALSACISLVFVWFSTCTLPRERPGFRNVPDSLACKMLGLLPTLQMLSPLSREPELSFSLFISKNSENSWGTTELHILLHIWHVFPIVQARITANALVVWLTKTRSQTIHNFGFFFSFSFPPVSYCFLVAEFLLFSKNLIFCPLKQNWRKEVRKCWGS